VSEVLTLQLPSALVRQARALAAAANRSLDDVLAELIERGMTGSPVETMPDSELLAACDQQLPEPDQQELSGLLAARQDGPLTPADGRRLDELLATYRRGLVLKARAWKEAVARGIKPRLGEHAA
jgi:hypothetical protein